MTSPTKKFIGSRMKSLRKSKGITQAVLAEVLECEIATISRYERGENSPDGEQLLRLAKFFQVSPLEILPTERDVERETLLELRTTLLELIYRIENPLLLERLIRVIKPIDKK